MIDPFMLSDSPFFDKSFGFATPESSNDQGKSKMCLDDGDFKQQLMCHDKDEPIETLFFVDEAEQKLINTVDINVSSEQISFSTPLELKLYWQNRCDKFFQKRTPTPPIARKLIPLLQPSPMIESPENSSKQFKIGFSMDTDCNMHHNFNTKCRKSIENLCSVGHKSFCRTPRERSKAGVYSSVFSTPILLSGSPGRTAHPSRIFFQLNKR